MTSRVSTDIFEHCARQIEYLKRSCDLYDQGHVDEAARIATTIRVLFHDTKQSVSLLSLAEKKDIKLLSSIGWVGPLEVQQRIFEFHAAHPHGPREWSGLTIVKRNTDGSFQVKPSLGVKEHCVLIPVEDWWNQLVHLLPNNEGMFSRRGMVLVAANKDGGAHVDLKLPPQYVTLRKKRVRGFRPAAVDLSLSPDNPTLQDWEIAPVTASDINFASIRQMGYELLLSEELLALGGKTIGLRDRPTIFPL